MTKDEWLETRKKPEIPMDVWFSFYKEKGGKADRNFFEEMFARAIFQEPIFVKLGKKVTFASCLRNLFNYYNTKFGV